MSCIITKSEVIVSVCQEDGLTVNKIKRLSGTCASAYPCAILNAVDVELHGDVKAVEEIPPKHQRVLWGVHSVDPPYNTEDTGCMLRPAVVKTEYVVMCNMCHNKPDGIMKVLPCLSSIL